MGYKNVLKDIVWIINLNNGTVKILCLHGCRQNAEIFRQKTGSLRKLLSKYAEFTFLDAPHSIRPLEGDPREDILSWWFTGPDRSYKSTASSETDLGFSETVELVGRFMLETGPYDGLLGFSQGAGLAAILVSMAQNSELCDLYSLKSIKFVILVAGFKSLCSPHNVYYQSILRIPSLHVIGDTDDIITKDRSEDLMSLFEDGKIIRHPGGHYVPCSKDQRESYITFFEKLIEKKL